MEQKGFTSDRRLKEDIVKVGVDTRTNLNLYEFSYLGNPSRYVGVMADEVEVFYPNAVFYGKHFYKAVNYEMLGIDFRKVANMAQRIETYQRRLRGIRIPRIDFAEQQEQAAGYRQLQVAMDKMTTFGGLMLQTILPRLKV